jgi:hypothetical protein
LGTAVRNTQFDKREHRATDHRTVVFYLVAKMLLGIALMALGLAFLGAVLSPGGVMAVVVGLLFLAGAALAVILLRHRWSVLKLGGHKHEAMAYYFAIPLLPLLAALVLYAGI